MAPIGTLWGDARQRQTRIIRTVAAVNGLEIDLRPKEGWSFVNKPAEFMAKFPYGKIPTFEGADGLKLSEGVSIARYLSSIGTEVNLLGTNAHEVAIVDQWVRFGEHEIGLPTQIISGIVYGYLGVFSLEMIDKCSQGLARALSHLESHLATRPSGYVALDTLTLADIVIAGGILAAASVALGSAERAQWPRVFAHYEKVTADERVKAYWGTESFVDVRITEPRTRPIN